VVACQDAVERNLQEEEAFQGVEEEPASRASVVEEEVLSSYHQEEEPSAFVRTVAAVLLETVAVVASCRRAEEDHVPLEDLDRKQEAAEACVPEVG
jgi:hypothetical protein